MLPLILLPPAAFMLLLAIVALRSWPWFFAIVLVFHLGGALACAVILLLGEAAWALAPLQAWPFYAWRAGECALLVLTLLAGLSGATLRGLGRIWKRWSGGVGGVA